MIRAGMRAAAAIATIAAAFTVGGPSASAATVFGADLSQTPDWPSSIYSMTTVMDPGGAANAGAPVSGILSSVRIKTRGAGGSGVIRILTLSSHPDAFTYNFYNDPPEIPVDVTADATPGGHVTQVLTRRPIAAGQHLGWYVNDPAGNIKENYVDASAECAYTNGSTAGPTTTQPYSTASCNHNVPLLSGTIEADADGDGFGDDTQDLCPSNATTQGSCPTPASTTTVPPLCAGKTGIALKRCRCKHKSTEAKRKKCLRRLNAAIRRD